MIWIFDRKKLFKLKPPVGLRIVYFEGKGLSLFSNKVYRKNERIIKLEGILKTLSRISSNGGLIP
ncbi:MAG: hypothetical protein COT91_03665 [Candidatus Doudnabacteria bacterium CG10_big_fil_rev_8_21_14_0_10_41_10]|uniref:Uncharacterized protein n=1 Tax=Candidatus Doudnabacteria bacterium CG10_big_fil_rev_8_21_14_0_10_41_10 TaxID=1974551 RepID=A0A2H0VCZ4_9BACT|nr:MAG: hypothetical protein COT91_03665 [Candidatus Doudnabacteria bacterium CG10_big_fil_rev_8_21_14_0_10_41_10]